MNKPRIHQEFALRWIRLVSVLFIIIHLSFSASAQVRVEYWFDHDPGLGKATKMVATADADGNVQFDVPTVALSVGTHLMGIRSYHLDAEDNPSYGPTLLRQVAVHRSEFDESISHLEYFWDEDPGPGHGTAIIFTPDEVVSLQNLEISTEGMEPGRHVLHVRSYGGYGWSPTVSQEVMVTGGALAIRYVEYFWDEDPGMGYATPLVIVADGEVNLEDVEIPTTGLSCGIHRLGIRAFGSGWSPTVFQEAFVPLNSNEAIMSCAEYFWDEDPGYGQGIAISITPGQEVSITGLELPIDTLSTGCHQLFVRYRGVMGWSPTVCADAIIIPETEQKVLKAEYFWDEDPGYGQGITISITPGQEVSITDLELPIDTLSTGYHQLFVRYRGVMGWSPTVCADAIIIPETEQKVLKVEYFWDEDPGYGNGTPLQISPEQVLSLDNLSIPTSDIHGDAMFGIRYLGPLGWSPTVTQRIFLDAEGNYTLNAEKETSIDERNYQSLSDMVADFSDRGICDRVKLTLPTANTEYALEANSEDVLSQLAAISTNLDRISPPLEAKLLCFTASEGTGNSLSIVTTAEGLPTVVDLFTHVQLDNVSLSINGTAYDFTEVANTRHNQEVCSSDATSPVDCTELGEGVTVTWTAQPHKDILITGYEATATGTLPAMKLKNIGMKTDSIAYRVELSMGETLLATYTYYIYVYPRVSEQSFTSLSPADGNSLDPGKVQLKWSAIGGAKGYRLEITDNEEPLETISVKGTSYEMTISTGHSYTWKVIAVGLCDELEGPEMMFSGRLLPDLVVTGITMPEAAEAGNTITVTATIENQGEGATTESSWTDRLHYAIDSDNFQRFVKAAEVKHTGVLGIGESYEVSFSFTAPQAEEGLLRVFVIADAENNVMETNVANNRTLSANAATMAPFYVNANDLAVLRSLYNELGGDSWNGTKWDATSELIRPDNWSGVTFDTEGRVTAINLQNRNLRGELSTRCAVTLPQLNSLNLCRNALTGDVSTFLTNAPLLTSVNLSYNQLGNLSSSLPATITSLNMTYQHRNADNWYGIPGIDVYESVELNVGRSITATLPSLVSYNHGGQAFNTHPKINLLGRSDYIHYGTLVWDVVNEVYTYEPNVNLLTATQDAEVLAEPQSGSAQYGRYPAYLHFTLGDANLSGWVDVNDVQLTLNYIMNNYRNIGLWAANTFTEDETSTVINIQDIVTTVNIVLDNQGLAASRRAGHFGASEHTEPETARALFYVDSRKLMVETTEEIGAFDLELTGVDASQVKLLLNSRQWQIQARNTKYGVRMVVFSPTGETLPAGTTQLLRLGGNATPVAVQATSPDAEEVRAAVGENTITGIDETISSYENRDTYDLLGRKVDSGKLLRKGIYINNGKKIKK